jgi:hypothetical protein
VPSAPVVPPSTPAAVQRVAPTITTDPVAFLRGEWRWARALAAAVLVGLAVWWLRVSAVGGRDEERSVLARRFPAGEGVAPALR